MNLPIGSIILWTSVSIPDGWAICDGTNGTPNLVGKFVKGAANDGEVGSTGGSAQHDHTNSDLSGDAGHGHTGVTVSTGTSDNTKMYGYSSGTEMHSAASHNHGTESLTPNNRTAHTHPISNVDLLDNLPPYKTLIYIMRII